MLICHYLTWKFVIFTLKKKPLKYQDFSTIWVVGILGEKYVKTPESANNISK